MKEQVKKRKAAVSIMEHSPHRGWYIILFLRDKYVSGNERKRKNEQDKWNI
jgi:hypothetical protein